MFHMRFSAYGDEHGRYDPRLLRRLLAYLRPFAGRIALGLLLVVISTVMSLLGP
jgi:hypothetical protein